MTNLIQRDNFQRDFILSGIQYDSVVVILSQEIWK